MKRRAALIGSGRISYKHREAYAANREKLELAAICDPVFERAERAAAEYGGGVKPYADYRRMLEEIRPEVVSVAAESGKHAAITLDCLDAGCHVICEKPMALSTAGAEAMIARARERGLKLGVCFQNRFNAPVRRLRTALEGGRFGKILHGMIQVRWNRGPGYYAEAPWRGTWAEDGGTLMNQCTHGIDLLQWMLGEDPVRVQAATRRFLRPIEAEDFGAAVVEFRSGAVGVIEGSACVYPANLSETLSVFGERGTAVIGGLAVNRLETWRFADAASAGDAEETVLTPGEKDPPTVYGFGHTALFKDFVEALEQNREPLVSGEQGKKALEIILAIYQSQKTGLPVDLPCDFSTLQMRGTFK
jgi:predicted dehydrogenase